MNGRGPLQVCALAAAAAVLVAAAVYQVARADLHRVHGDLNSAGQGWDTWRSTAMTCALDPQDGQPAASSATRVSLLWLDGEAGDPTRYLRWDRTPDQPLQLDVIGWPPGTSQPGAQAGVVAVLRTVKHESPLVLDAGVCSRLELETAPEAPLVREGRPALGGTLRLDCRSAGRHLSGEIQFNRCGY